MAQENSDISKLFINILNDINLIEKSKFYKKDDSFSKIKEIIKQWYDNYKLNKILTSITVKDLEYLDLEITSFFDKYIESESIKENYSDKSTFALIETLTPKVFSNSPNIVVSATHILKR